MYVCRLTGKKNAEREKKERNKKEEIIPAVRFWRRIKRIVERSALDKK